VNDLYDDDNQNDYKIQQLHEMQQSHCSKSEPSMIIVESELNIEFSQIERVEINSH
jgi:hypothetical protein